MKDTQNILIVLLVVTAAVIATMLALTLSSRPAYADSSVRAGDYIMLVGAFNKTKDLLYVINVPSQQLNVYEINPQNGMMNRVDMVNLEKLFKGP